MNTITIQKINSFDELKAKFKHGNLVPAILHKDQNIVTFIQPIQ